MKYSSENKNSQVNEPAADDSTEMLKQALKRSYTERFLMATTLYKIQQTMSKAQVTHKSYKS
ncbi:hypothetical protein BH09BAC2_BH09BAC2_18440 [soil metagenome]